MTLLRPLAVIGAAVPLLLSAQTELVADFGTPLLDPFPREFTVSGNKLFFTAFAAESGWEMWVTEGALATTHLVKDINPGAAHGTASSPAPIAFNGGIIFMADDGEHGRELWKSDGTEAGTMMLSDIQPGSNEGLPKPLCAVGGHVLFTADDGSGRRLYSTDGLVTGSITDHVLDAFTQPPLVLDGVAYFFAWTPITNNYALWSSGGSSAALVKNLGGGGVGSELTALGNGFFFRGFNNATGAEVWYSNGSTNGTSMVVDMMPGPDGANPRNLMTMGGQLYFLGQDDNGRGLFRIQGGTPVAVTGLSIYENFNSSYPTMAVLGDRHFRY